MQNVFSYTNSKGVVYYLNTREVKLRNGITTRIYFFSKDVRPTGLETLPEGWEVMEVQNTYMPVLKRIKK